MTWNLTTNNPYSLNSSTVGGYYLPKGSTTWQYVSKSYYLTIKVSLVATDTVNKQSLVNIELDITGLQGMWFTGYSGAQTAYTIKIDGTNIATGNYGTMPNDGGPYTIKKLENYVIPHNTDGTKSFVLSATYAGSTSTNNLPRAMSVTSDTIVLPKTNSPSVIESITPSTLQSGYARVKVKQTLSTNKATVSYSINNSDPSSGTWVQVGTTGTGSTTINRDIQFNDIKNVIGTNTSAVVYVKVVSTDSAGTSLGAPVVGSFYVKTGAMAMSLKDDKNGTVGATFGEKATGGGFNVYLDSQFGKSTDRKKMTTYLGTTDTTGEIRHGNVDLADATYSNKLVNVYSDTGATSGTWSDWSKYTYYIFQCTTSDTTTPNNIVSTGIIPAICFGTTEEGTFGQRVHVADSNGDGCTWQFWHVGDTGHFSRRYTSSSGYGFMFKIWGVK